MTELQPHVTTWYQLCRTVLVCLSLFTNNGFQIHFQATKISACTLRESLDTEFFNSFAMEFSPRRLHWLSISAQGKVRSSILTSSRNVQFITKPLHWLFKARDKLNFQVCKVWLKFWTLSMKFYRRIDVVWFKPILMKVVQRKLKMINSFTLREKVM